MPGVGTAEWCAPLLLPGIFPILVIVFQRHVVFGHFARLHRARVGIGCVLNSSNYAGFESLPFFYQFFDTLGPNVLHIR